MVQTADPLWRVIRYVERNPLRAGLVDRAEDWPWSSLAWWMKRGLAPHPSAVPVPFSFDGAQPVDDATVGESPGGAKGAGARQAIGAPGAESEPAKGGQAKRGLAPHPFAVPVPFSFDGATPADSAQPVNSAPAAEAGRAKGGQAPPTDAEPVPVSPVPIPLELRRPEDWLATVNQPQTDEELAALHLCLSRGRPYGSDAWINHIARTLGLESTLRPRGRPRKRAEK